MKYFLRIVIVICIVFTSVNVSGQGWTVNPSAYSNTGTLTAVVYHGTNEVSTGTLGAFVGGVCRGVVDGIYFGDPIFRTYFILTCNSNVASGETLTLRYYDPTDGTIYNINETVGFVSDMILGDIFLPLQFHTVPLISNVTGGGSYCEVGTGLPVGLNDSEIGVTYTLFKNSIAQPSPISGTGAAISFGNQLGGPYTVKGTNSGGTIAMTGSAVIIENPSGAAGVSITAVPSGAICSGTSVAFTAIPTNGGTTPTYIWMKGGVAIPGATNSTYTTTTLVNEDVISVEMTSSATCATGSPVTSAGTTMTVNPLLPAGVSIAAVPSGAICAGTSVTFTATPTNGGSSPVYKWKLNGSNVGTNSPSYTSTTLANGNVITVEMTSDAVCATGNPASSGGITMSVNTVPTVATASVTPTSVCGSGTVTLSATASSGTIKWYTALTGGTEVAVLNPTISSTTTYYAEATSPQGCISVARTPVTATVNTIPAPPTGSAAQSFCSIALPKVSDIAITATGTVIWYTTSSGGSVVPASTLLVTGTTYYASQTISGCESDTRLAVTITVSDPAPPTGSAAQSFCSGTSPTVADLLATGASVKWYLASSGGAVLATSAALASGHYYASQTVSGCESDSRFDVNVTVNPTPSVLDQTTSMVTGTSFTVTPGGVPVGTTYTWTAPSYTGGVVGGTAQSTGQSNISGSLTIPTGTGTAVYTVTPKAGSCTGATFLVTVTVTSSCIPVTVGTQPINTNMCATSGNSAFTVVAAGSGPFTYQWQYYNGSTWNNVANGIPSGVTYSNSTTATLNVSGITTDGNYQYRCYITNCSGSKNATSTAATLTVNPLPATPAIGTITQPTCSLPTGSVVLNGLPAGSWTINPGAITGSTTSTSITGLVPATYTFTVTNSLGCTSLPSSNIVILPEPAKPAAPGVGTLTLPTCNVPTGSVILAGLPAGAWVINPGNISGTGSTTTIYDLAAGTYKYTVTNSIGCTSVFSSDIVINAQPLTPAVVITNPTAVCSPAKVNLTASELTAGSTSGLTYTYWTNVAATIAYSTPAAASAGTYYIKGTTTAGCFDIKPVTATVNPLPSANAGTGGSECDLDFTFSAVPGIGTGTWTMVSGPGTATFTPDANSPTATVTVTAYGNYTFAWTEVSNSCATSSNVTVSFSQQPVANAGTGGNNCGLVFTFNAVPGVGTGTWTKTSVSGTATISPDANSPTAKVTVSSYGAYTFTWTEANNTCSSSSSVNVTFLQVPVANAGNDGSECDKDFILNAGSGTGLWTKLSGPGNAVFSPDAGSPGAKVTVDQSGTYDFTWTEMNGTCESTDVVRVIFRSLPAVSAGKDTTICISDNIQLQGVGTGTFSWEPAVIIINPKIKNPVAAPLSTTEFIVTLTDQYGCINSDTVLVSVRDIPVAYAGPDMVLEYLYGTSLVATEPGVNETGNWSVIDGSGVFTNNSNAVTEVSELALGENILLWSVTNGVCPPANDYLSITVNNLVIPTLITPNMDGKNDYFVLRGIETLGKTELTIFDRRGALVYKNSNYDNTWNGVDYNDTPLLDDTYFFVIKSEKGKSFSGYIVVRR